ADPRALVTHGEPQRSARLLETHPDRRGPSGARVRGVADQVHQHVVERVGIAFEIDLVERGIELQGDLLVPEHTALERAAGADHAHGVEPLRARQRAAGAVLDGAQEVDAAVDVVDHLAELVEHLQPPRRGDLGPAAERFHGELEARPRRGQRVRDFVGDDARQGGVDVELAVMVAGRGVARGLGLELGTGGHLPHGDGPAAERPAGLPQDLASALHESLWSAHPGSIGAHGSAAAVDTCGRRRSRPYLQLQWGARTTYAISARWRQATAARPLAPAHQPRPSVLHLLAGCRGVTYSSLYATPSTAP